MLSVRLSTHVDGFDFAAKLVFLREKKRSRDETFRTVDMSPKVEAVVRAYFADGHPSGTVALCSPADRVLADGQAWKAFRTGG